MPSITGYVDEEQDERIQELIDRGVYEDRSDFIQSATSYILYNKY